jgi:glycosyltransferase involved in cell wall biosynthesis
LPKVYTCHSLSFEEYATRNKNQTGVYNNAIFIFNLFGRKWIEKYVLKKSHKIIVLSEFTCEKLKHIYNIFTGKISVIPGGVDLEKFYPLENKMTVRDLLKIPFGKVILFTIRNLVERMGLENLILALKNLREKAPDIFLILGGEGPLKDRLMSLAKEIGVEEHIKFTGFINEKQLPDFYRAADIFVLPTKVLEGFGMVTLEAMASGLPVLGTPVGGTKEILGKFDPSFLFDGTDSDSMAALILEKYYLIKNNTQKWNEISLRCRAFVESNYSWEKNIDAIETLFRKTMQNQHTFS